MGITLTIVSRVWFSGKLQEVYEPHVPFQFLSQRIEFEMDFKKFFFCWRSNVSNNDMISKRSGLKMVRFSEARSENVCEKLHFWSEIGSGLVNNHSHIAFHADVLRGSSRVPAPLRPDRLSNIVYRLKSIVHCLSSGIYRLNGKGVKPR